MGSVTIRKISDELKQAMRVEAAANGRSVEAELRALLESTFGSPGISEGSGTSHKTDDADKPRDNWVQELIRTANGAGEGAFEFERQPLREFDL